MNTSPNLPEHPADEVIASRLARLRQRPVDTARLDARLQELLPGGRRTGGQELEQPQRRLWIFAPQYRVLAASLALLLTVVAVLTAVTLSAQPASASEQRLAEIYQTAVTQQGSSTPVTSIEEARAALKRKWSGAPEIADAQATELHVMSCCVHEVGRKQMASITFLMDGSPVTAAVARSDEIKSPGGRRVMIDGESYVTAAAQGINMVMQERDGIWTCVMGRLPSERLAQLLESLHDDSEE